MPILIISGLKDNVIKGADGCTLAMDIHHAIGYQKK